MNYVTLLTYGQRRARKPHQCFDCYRTIPAGEVYAFQTCKLDGVYTLAQHLDCSVASEEYRQTAGLSDWDFDDGIPPLADIIRDGGEFAIDVAGLRGRFPHVACRLELNEQLAQLRHAARLEDAGIPLHPEDFPPIYG